MKNEKRKDAVALPAAKLRFMGYGGRSKPLPYGEPIGVVHFVRR